MYQNLDRDGELFTYGSGVVVLGGIWVAITGMSYVFGYNGEPVEPIVFRALRS